MKVLVTGGAGYIGSHIIELLVKKGEMVKKGQLLVTIENPAFITLQQEYLEANADELDARSRFDPYIEVDTDDQHEISARVEAYFWDPIAVEIDPEGRLIVADSLRHRLQIYQRLAD